MEPILEPTAIRGVTLARLVPHPDDRGRFVETFRRTWFPERAWDEVQSNLSESRAGTLRGLHYHLRQVDYWIPLRGRARAGLVDVRRSSPTRGEQLVVELEAGTPVGLFIPPGVAHGFLALTDLVLTYLVDAYYDGTDELGVAWDDPDLGIPWGTARPTLSPRDAGNPRLRDIPADRLPA
jgi:dTDP-4-dehydrorhamnose 3,5-epimerase